MYKSGADVIPIRRSSVHDATRASVPRPVGCAVRRCGPCAAQPHLQYCIFVLLCYQYHLLQRLSERGGFMIHVWREHWWSNGNFSLSGSWADRERIVMRGCEALRRKHMYICTAGTH